MDPIEFDMDLMDSVLSGHETYGVLINVNQLNETIVLVARWSDDL